LYSPVFLSSPPTSGSPPVRSISWSDHNFSAWASSRACTLAQSRPLWRFRFFSNRAFNVLSSSSRCFGDNSFLLVLMLLISICRFEKHNSVGICAQIIIPNAPTIGRLGELLAVDENQLRLKSGSDTSRNH